MRRACVLAVGLLALATAGLADDFSGRWEVSAVLNERDGFPWSREIKYPKQMTLQMSAGQLVGSYTDQEGFSCTFPLVVVLNQGHDLLLANCGETKAPEAYAPIHHVKLQSGRLHGVVLTNDRLFEWVATKRN